MDNEVYEHHVVFTGDKWAVKPANGTIIATFDSQEAAIEAGYKLALEAGNYLIVYNEQGEITDEIDPEDDLPLNSEIEDVLVQYENGELEMRPYQPSQESIDNVEASLRHRDL